MGRPGVSPHIGSSAVSMPGSYGKGEHYLGQNGGGTLNRHREAAVAAKAIHSGINDLTRIARYARNDGDQFGCKNA